MARSLDPQQKAELAEFLESLYRAGGYSSQAQWAREAGYHPTNLSDALNRSKNDGLDGYSLLRLMRAVAARSDETAEAAALRLAGEADDPPAWARALADRLAAVEDRVEELPTAADLKSGLESVRRSIARATRGIPAAESASKSQRKNAAQ